MCIATFDEYMGIEKNFKGEEQVFAFHSGMNIMYPRDIAEILY